MAHYQPHTVAFVEDPSETTTREQQTSYLSSSDLGLQQAKSTSKPETRPADEYCGDKGSLAWQTCVLVSTLRNVSLEKERLVS